MKKPLFLIRNSPLRNKVLFERVDKSEDNLYKYDLFSITVLRLYKVPLVVEFYRVRENVFEILYKA